MSKRQASQIDALAADVLEAAGALRRHGDLQAAAVGQTQARWQVLSVFSDDERTVPDAARRLGVSRQAVQRLVNELRVEGLVRVRGNPAHARSPLVSLSAAGRRILAALSEENEPWTAHASKQLRPKDVEATRRTLRRLIALTDAAEPVTRRTPSSPPSSGASPAS